jgi:CDP-diacylglycerol--glycerol-3-phosphate 3-phosphatidyltransferase
MQQKENIYNLPNLISFYRLAVFPLILWFVLSGNEPLFVVFICISLVSDILDGFIARTFGLVTRFGAALDNLADVGTYILAVAGLFRFRWEPVQPHSWILFLFLGIFALTYVIAFIRFRKMPGLHLYGGVIAGYLQGIFLFVLFVWGFFPWLYYLALGWGVLAYIEKGFVLMHLDDIRANTRGLYWVLREKRHRRQ